VIPLGAQVAAVRQVLEAPAPLTLPGRAVLALAAHEQAQAAQAAGVRRSRLLDARRVAWAAARARRLAARLLGGELAAAAWTGHPDGSASLIVGGLTLRFARGELALVASCPLGAPPHTVLVHNLVALGALVRLACVDPPGWPWACAGLCHPPQPTALEGEAAGGVFVVGATVPTGDEVMTITWITAGFTRARELLATQLHEYVHAAFTAEQLVWAREADAAVDMLPEQPPAGGAWAVTTGPGCRFWLCQHPGGAGRPAGCDCSAAPVTAGDGAR
jgi:hypothetical protein